MKYPRPTKEEYRPLFLALQADCKSFPGGITALAERIGVTKFTLASAVNPDQTNASPPSLGVLLEVVTLAQARRTVFELCHLVGQIPIDVDVEESSARDSVQLFLALTQKASNVLGAGALAAEDGRFDVRERQQLDGLLADLIQAATSLRVSLRSA